MMDGRSKDSSIHTHTHTHFHIPIYPQHHSMMRASNPVCPAVEQEMDIKEEPVEGQG